MNAGKGKVVDAPAVVGAGLDVNMAPVPFRSSMAPSSGAKVLSVLNFNEMNKRSVNWDGAEEFKSRKGFGIRGAFRKKIRLSTRITVWEERDDTPR